MAYVVSRPNGRFEIRESVLTASGPRARTLANFAVLTPQVMELAALRASRSFDPATVVRSAHKRGLAVDEGPNSARAGYERFVDSSRRMAKSLNNAHLPGPTSPGKSLMDLLNLADRISHSLPKRPFEPLAFPPLAKLASARP